MAKKFILIDPSLASIAGHYYEYALHVLEAAQRAGYEPYLATHRQFAKSPHQAPFKTFAIYRAGFWVDESSPSLLGRLWGWFEELRFRWRLFRNFSPFGLLWAVRDRFGEFLLKQPLDRTHLISVATLVPAAILIKAVRFLVVLLFLPFALIIFLGRSIWRVLKAGGFPEAYVRALVADLADGAYFLRELVARRNQLRNWLKQYRMLRSFQTDTERLLKEVEAKHGDILFLPTTSAIELMGVSEVLRRRAPANAPSWHLLFRRDIYQGRETDYGAQDAQLNALRQVMAVASRKFGSHEVRFYTDTDELTAQHNRLGVFHFQTLPIPHTHTPRTVIKSREPLNVLYLGDARSEKGYHFIPNLIEDLWEEYVAPGKIRFCLQSNFNIPQGEPAVVVARHRLELLAAREPKAIELRKQALTSEQYKELLLSGDINLLLYDPRNYFARSSGILVEALSTAMPVVAPAGTWLSRQFRDATFEYRRALRERVPVVRVLDMAELRWQTSSGRFLPPNGESLTAAGHAPIGTTLRLPDRATHLLIELGGPRECLMTVDQLDSKGHSISTTKSLLESGRDGTAFELLALDSQCRRVAIRLRSVCPGDTSVVRHFRVDVLSHQEGGKLPQGAVGVAYLEPEQITAALRELIDNYGHYRQTAQDFAASWRDSHNADRLVQVIRGSAG
ncbi:MAG: hypothetical protein NZV14_20040 [Bryobacteraceae bacterium]|nr:hypothetical protein [Bryobacteraceae bacterium]MDW8380457.1 hypothetical protein [Bryobacterales bacterium]